MVQAISEELLAVAKAYEQWEADLVTSNEAWKGGTAELPTLTWELWDSLLEIQGLRNKAVKRAEAKSE